MIKIVEKIRSQARLLKRVAITIAVYAALGFFLLPWFSERYLVQFSQERLALQTQVESIYFNPFTFYLEVNDLDITSGDGAQLVTLDQLYLNFQPSRLFLLKYQLSEFLVAGLDVYFERQTESENTLSRLLDAWNATAAPVDTALEPVEEEPVSDLAPVEILLLQVADLNFHVRDEVPATFFETTFSLVSAEIENFSTLAGEEGANNLAITFEEGASLGWTGAFTVDPLELSGAITLGDLSLTTASRYLQDTLPFAIDEGRLGLKFSYQIGFVDESLNVLLDDISVELNEISVQEDAALIPFLVVNNIAVSGGQLRIPENRAIFDSASIDGIELSIVRESDGQLNLQRLLSAIDTGADPAQTATVEPAATSSSNARPWQFSLGSFALSGSQFNVEDQSLENPFAAATTLDFTVSNISNESFAEMPFSGALELSSGGIIGLEGDAQVLPQLGINSTLSINALDISLFQPYLSEYAYIELERGFINFNSELTVNDEESFGFTGGIAIDDLLLIDERLNETLLSMDSLAVEEMEFSLDSNNLEISEVLLDSFFARVIVNQDGSTNIARSIKTGADEVATESEAPESTENLEENGSAANPLAISIGRIRLDDASANFTDLNLPLVFNTNIHGLSGSAEGIANNSSQPTAIVMEGQVDEFGLVQISANLLPFDFFTQSQIDVEFTNLHMPSITPYVVKFAGREIADGDVDLSLSYQLQEGELVANNQLVLSQLVLGDRVESPDAMDLPLDLAIALLKDSRGVIDFEVPVTGNVNDPEFDFGPAIRTALRNILTNIVAAPFRLLGRLVGGGDEAELDRIRFLPGRSDIAAPEREVLQNLMAALAQRPQLALQIPAMNGEADVNALQILSVDARIEELVAAGEGQDVSRIDRRRAAVEQLYLQLDAAAASQTLEDIQLLHTAVAAPESGDIQSAVADAPASESSGFDTLAYVADLRERLMAAELITQADLAALAGARQQAVVQYITSTGAITEQSYQLLQLQESELDEDGWLIMQFDLESNI